MNATMTAALPSSTGLAAAVAARLNLGAAAAPAPRDIDGVRYQVGMGQLKIGGRTEQLQALLGSCVGIGLIWKKGGRCGLAHCLLPEAPQAEAGLGARYVSQAVPSLLRLMGATKADYADIEVVLAGGANMLSACSSRMQVGRQNADAAQKYLRACGLQVRYCRVGGNHGRTMTIDCADHSFAVSDIVQH